MKSDLLKTHQLSLALAAYSRFQSPCFAISPSFLTANTFWPVQNCFLRLQTSYDLTFARISQFMVFQYYRCWSRTRSEVSKSSPCLVVTHVCDFQTNLSFEMPQWAQRIALVLLPQQSVDWRAKLNFPFSSQFKWLLSYWPYIMKLDFEHLTMTNSHLKLIVMNAQSSATQNLFCSRKQMKDHLSLC